MTPSSPTPDERARKAYSAFLQRLSPDGTQRNLAHVNGVSESTITRWKETAEPVLKLCAQLGLKLVDEGKQCTDPGELKLLRSVYARVADQAPWLLDQGDA